MEFALFVYILFVDIDGDNIGHKHIMAAQLDDIAHPALNADRLSATIGQERVDAFSRVKEHSANLSMSRPLRQPQKSIDRIIWEEGRLMTNSPLCLIIS